MKNNCAATIYNKFVISGSEHYQRTEISAVEWQNRKQANVIKSGLLAADSVTVYVSFTVGDDYLKPKAWQALSVKTGKWTLAIGDVIVKGIVTDEIHDAVVNPPSAAFTMTDLKAKYDDVVTIKSVDTMDMGSLLMRHWQIGAS